MTKQPRRTSLEAEHTHAGIRTRLARERRHSYLGDAVLGAIDGCVTTFAVVAGAAGANFPRSVTLILGFANLLADGFSMAASNYQRSKSDRERLAQARAAEERHIEEIPAGERREIHEIFARKGFSGEVLDEIVRVITRDRRRWVDTMLTEELGLRLAPPQPLRAALATFAAFCAAGLIPLLPYLAPAQAAPQPLFYVSCVGTGAAFALIGVLKGYALGRRPLRAGAETLLVGGAAATLAYIVGLWLGSVIGMQ